MPTYEYECQKCSTTLEVFQSITATPKRKCPECGSPRGLRRKIGAGAGIIFRGSGFYQTDYRSQEYKKAAKADTDGAKSGSAEAKDVTGKTSAEETGAEATASVGRTASGTRTAQRR